MADGLHEPDTGGPAFPLRSVNTKNGMSLRDYFAAAALTGLVAHVPISQVSEKAFRVADLMLAARGAK